MSTHVTSNAFRDRLSSVATQMESVLATVLPERSGRQAIIMEAVRYAALGGGKRLRPFLMIETARMLGYEEAPIWNVAAALECLHVYSLVHDDLPAMDDDDLRRGKPTVHKAYDEAIAVLAGDALLTRSFGIISDPALDLSPAIRLELVSLLAKAGGMFGMIGGQVVDITVSEFDRDEDLIIDLQSMKTGALISYAVEAGAIIAGATAKEKEKLTIYAECLGLAFQIKDDILDVEGDAKDVGKAVGKDAALGKATFVSILGLEGAKKRAQNLADQAKDQMVNFGDAADTLCHIVDFVLQRKK